MIAPNGARKTKADHPALPITPDELAATAASCLAAGASMLHLHVRDRDGRHTLEPDAYRTAISAVRRAVGDRLVIQATTEAVGRFTPAEQMGAIRELRPEAVSLAIRELVPDAGAEPAAAAFFAWLERERIVPQHILYSPDDVARLGGLRARGVIPGERPFALFVLGRYTAGQRSSPLDLLPFLEAWRRIDPAGDGLWSLCAFGRREAACALAAAAFDGHVRLGFENNDRLADGAVAPDNAALVAQFVAAATAVGRALADADAARALIG